MIIRLQGIKRTTVKGRTYYYHRATGKAIKAEAGSAAFAEEVARLDKLAAAGKDAPKATPNTWGWLVELYRGSPEWLQLAPRTRKDYQSVFDYLDAPEAGKRGMRDLPLEHITGPSLMSLRDKTFAKRGRRMANYALVLISIVFNWGRPRGKCGANPAEDLPRIRRPRDARQVNRPWTDGELAAVLAAAPEQLKLAIALGAYVGLREGDALRLPWSAYDGEAIEWRQAKTGEIVWVPAHRELRTMLDGARRQGTIMVVNSWGSSFTDSGFRASFFKLIRKLAADGKVGKGLTFHGLRHTVATRLADAGADERTIMAVTGHATQQMVAGYTKTADRRRRAKAAMKLLEGECESFDPSLP